MLEEKIKYLLKKYQDWKNPKEAVINHLKNEMVWLKVLYDLDKSENNEFLYLNSIKEYEFSKEYLSEMERFEELHNWRISLGGLHNG